MTDPGTHEASVLDALRQRVRVAQSNIGPERPTGSSDPAAPDYNHDSFMWDWYGEALTTASGNASGVQLAASRKNRVYLAGPMTGIADLNFPAFNAAAAALRDGGRIHVENPAEHGVVEGATWADYLHYDITRLATCEAIVMLPGWSKSKGALLELHIAQALGMKVILSAGAEHDDADGDLRQAVGETLTTVLARLCEDGAPDWFDSRNVDEVIEQLEPVIKRRASDRRTLRMLQESLSNTLDDRDDATQWADKLATAIADHQGIDIGEHSNVNNPWLNAFEALDALTDDPLEDPDAGGAAAEPMRAPTGEELYLMVCSRFESGHFPWHFVKASGQAAWNAAAADLLLSPDTILARYGKGGA